MPVPRPGVRLLPNAITVLALCSGLSAVQFALKAQWPAAIAAITAAAVFDAVDGRIARLLDATSRIGAELDSLSDCVSFGVAPALVVFLWRLDGYRTGWVVTLVFVVCVTLRLARFNTLLDDAEAPPFAQEFFVGVPSPAGALLTLLPLVLAEQAGPGWWSSRPLVAGWTVAVGILMISRVPTLSLKTVRVPPRLVAPLLVLVGLAGAAVVTFPFGLLAAAAVGYLAHLPYSVYRYRWLAGHPEAWGVPPRQRRALRRAGSARRLGLRRPLGGQVGRQVGRRVAGAAARAGAAALGRGWGRADGAPDRADEVPLRADGTSHEADGAPNGVAPAVALPRGSRRIGLRRARGR